MTPLGYDMRYSLWNTEISALVVLAENLPVEAKDALSRAYDFDNGRHFWENEKEKSDREACIRLCLWQAIVAQGFVKPFFCPTCGIAKRYTRQAAIEHEERTGHETEGAGINSPCWEEKQLFLDPPTALRQWGRKRYDRVWKRLMGSIPPGAQSVITELTAGIPEMGSANVQEDPYLLEIVEGQKILRASEERDMQIAWEDHKKKVQHTRLTTILDLVKSLEREYGTAKKAEILGLAQKNGIPEPEAEKAIEKLKLDGYLFEPKNEVYKST